MEATPALELASEVHDALALEGDRPLLIGAVALAVHGYVRATQDVDFGLAVPPARLEKLAQALMVRLPNVTVHFEAPSTDDPLGGVINVTRGSGSEQALVQVVNFDNAPSGGFPALVQNAQIAEITLVSDHRVAVVSVEDLIFFKLYAGGHQSKADALALLTRCKVDEDRLRSLAERYRMTRELDEVLPRAGA